MICYCASLQALCFWRINVTVGHKNSAMIAMRSLHRRPPRLDTYSHTYIYKYIRTYMHTRTHAHTYTHAHVLTYIHSLHNCSVPLTVLHNVTESLRYVANHLTFRPVAHYPTCLATLFIYLAVPARRI